MPTSHARLSASSADRWIHCPGSVTLSEQLPPPPSSDYAEAGTEAHKLAELKLRKATGKLDRKQSRELRELREKGRFYDSEMEEATSLYVDMVREEMTAVQSKRCLIEQRLDLSFWVPDGFGTSDAVLLGKDTIEVIDFKYGQGVKVSAIQNAQIRLYGLGALDLFGDLNDFETIRMTIMQPRIDHISTEEISVKELLLWGEETVQPRAVMAAAGSDYFEAGDWCRFCPGKAVCRKRAEVCQKAARFDFRDPPLLSDEEIAEILAMLPKLTAWASDVSDYALQQAIDGTHYEGFKVVEGRSIRKWSDDLAVADRLIAAGYDEALLYERKLNGITAMEKLVGKKKLTELVPDLIIRPQGKPVLVPDTDPREDYHRLTAAEDFAD